MSQRPGTSAAIKLFESDDLATWRTILAKYDQAVQLTAEEKSKPGLIRLDEWLWHRFRDDVSSRSPPHITHSELADLMRWKLMRGKFRPLQGLVESNSPAAVIAASTKALKCLNLPETTTGRGSTSRTPKQWKACLNELCVLKAIGVATASVIVAVFSPDSCAFMADEVIETTCAKRDYTLAVYCRLQESVAAKQLHLQELDKKSAVLSKGEAKAEAAAGTKRKYVSADTASRHDNSLDNKHNDDINSTSPRPLPRSLSCEDIGKALWTAAVLSIRAPAEYDSIIAASAVIGAVGEGKGSDNSSGSSSSNGSGSGGKKTRT